MYFDARRCKLYVGRKTNAASLGGNWNNPKNYIKKIQWTKYQIKESDFRTKTATFTSPVDLDLTTGLYFLRITSPYHENFVGPIISNEYDEENDLYSYQCQDWSRMYQSKPELIPNKATVYELLEYLITRGGVEWFNKKKKKKQKKKFKNILKGLRPIEMYYQAWYGNILKINPMKKKMTAIMRDRSYMELIRDLTIGTVGYVDVYFNDNGVIQVRPLARKDWYNTGLFLYSNELQNRKIKFDTTNVITDVRVNGTKYSIGKLKTSESLLGLDLSAFFGSISTTINPQTTTTTTTTQSSEPVAAGSNPYGNKSKKLWIDADSGSDGAKNSIARALEKAGWSVHVGGTGPGYHYSDYWDVGSDYQCLLTVYNGFCAGTIREAYSDSIQNTLNKKNVVLIPVFETSTWTNERGMKPYKYGDFSGYNAKRAWDDNFSGSDPSIDNVSDWFKKNNAIYCCHPTTEGIVEQFLAGGYFKWAETKGIKTGTTEQAKTTTQTTVNEKAVTKADMKDKIYEHSRDLFSCKITLPLGNKAFKRVHTNQFLFTVLPTAYDLANWTIIGKALSSDYNRFGGAKTNLNRWYIEGTTVNVDASGTGKMELELNAFPSSQKAYSEQVKKYEQAYKDAAKKTTTKTNAVSDGGSNSSFKGGQGKVIDDLVKNIIGNETDDLKKAKLIHGWLQENVRYSYYECERYGGAENCYNNRGHLNCADTATLTCSMMLAAGLNAYTVHRTYDGGHFWCVIEINGQKYASDQTGDGSAWNTVWKRSGRTGDGGNCSYSNKCGDKAYC